MLIGVIRGLIKIPATIRSFHVSPLGTLRNVALKVTLFILGFYVLAALGNTSAYGRGQAISQIWIFATLAVLIYAVSAVVRLWKRHGAHGEEAAQHMHGMPVAQGIVYPQTADGVDGGAPASTPANADMSESTPQSMPPYGYHGC